MSEYERINALPQEVVPLSCNSNYTPVLYVQRINSPEHAILKLHLDKEMTKQQLLGRNLRDSIWKIDGFHLSTGTGIPGGFNAGQALPNGLMWNIALMAENVCLFDFMKNPSFLLPQAVEFPVGAVATHNILTHAFAQSISLEFTGKSLSEGTTRIKMTTKHNPTVTYFRGKNTTTHPHMSHLYYLDLSFGQRTGSFI